MDLKSTAINEQLAELRHEAEERDAKRRAAKLALTYINLGKTPISIEALKLIPEAEAREGQLAGIELKVRDVAIAVFNPSNPATKRIIADLESKRYVIKNFITSLGGLEHAWRMYKFIPPEAKEITGEVQIGQKRLVELQDKLTTLQAIHEEFEKVDFKKINTTNLVEIILAGAFALKASDIHFEAEEQSAKIRFRLDGLLHDIFTELPPHNYGNLISRFKLLAGLKINVYGEPQDGRFSIKTEKKEIEMRVSVIPSEFGETIVMRILDPDAITVDLPKLGLRKDDLDIVERQLAKPNGLILNTGPTGSGKTTTLYAFLQELNDPEMKIITIEDPIEYRIEGIEQTQVDVGANYTFARGLRAIVRQDPDIILVGEIRDAETSDIALQAALTGHLVLSTLHTNDAVGAVPRLVNLGAKPAVIGPALNLVIAQRLVRKLCPNCKGEVTPPVELKKNLEKFIKELPPRVNKTPYENYHIFESNPKGCGMCNGFGYKGRIGVFEFLESTSGFEETILKEASEMTLKKIAKEAQMVTMQEDGILKVLSGETSFDEVEKTTGKIQW